MLPYLLSQTRLLAVVPEISEAYDYSNANDVNNYCAPQAGMLRTKHCFDLIGYTDSLPCLAIDSDDDCGAPTSGGMDDYDDDGPCDSIGSISTAAVNDQSIAQSAASFASGLLEAPRNVEKVSLERCLHCMHHSILFVR